MGMLDGKAAFVTAAGGAIAGATSRPDMGRLGKPDEIARTALFLASDEASYTSGADHFVDAAYTAF